MELAELILEYLKVLIWPAVVVGVLIAFRREITARIRTSNIEFGAAGVTIKATTATAAQLAARRLGGGGEAKVETFTLMRPLRVRPRAARPERQVEAAFRTLAEMGVRDPRITSYNVCYTKLLRSPIFVGLRCRASFLYIFSALFSFQSDRSLYSSMRPGSTSRYLLQIRIRSALFNFITSTREVVST